MVTPAHDVVNNEDLSHIERVLAATVSSPPQAPPRGEAARWSDSLHRPLRRRGKGTEYRSLPLDGTREGTKSLNSKQSLAALHPPGAGSTERVWHCKACNCRIPRRSGSNSEECDFWKLHVAGRSHQRHLLSIRETGKPGSLLVSAFETITPSEIRHFKRGTPGRRQSSTQMRLLGILRQAALKELLHHTGATSSDYDRLSSRFEESRLQDSWVMLTEHRFPRRFFHQLTANHWQKTKLDLGVDAAMLAALSVAITTGHVPQTELVLDVLPGHPLDFNALLAALVLFCKALCGSSVQSLTLSFQSLPAFFATRRLSPALRGIEEAFKRCTQLRLLRLHLRSAGYDIEDLPIEDLHRTAKASIRRCRSAALSGLLARGKGFRASLPELSQDAISLILDKCVPLSHLTTEICASLQN